MGLFGDKATDKMRDIKIGDPKKIFTGILKDMSGGGKTHNIRYDMIYTVYAFKGVCDGVGTSTIVANTAIALAELGLSVCVVDTSILNPCQDILLKTGKEEDEPDWFDMPYIQNGYLKQSGFSNKVSVLSFYNRKRTVLDAVGIKDSSSLVSLMLTTLQGVFDIILIDCCSELTEINMACLQQSQRVIQVWSNTSVVVSNLDRFITNCNILTCPLDKMRHVILSKKDTLSYGGKVDTLLDQFKLTLIGTNNLSVEVAAIMNQGRLPYTEATKAKDVVVFSECIYSIISVMCNFKDVDMKDKVVTSEDMNKKEAK